MEVKKFNDYIKEGLSGFPDDLFKYIYINGERMYDMEETQEKFLAVVELQELKRKLIEIFKTDNVEVK